MRIRTALSLSLGALAMAGALGLPAGSAAGSPIKSRPAHILVNAKGMTLYVFAADGPKKSNCAGQCATYWPPALVGSGMKVAATIGGIAGTFGAITRADGSKQLTYDGAPLYTWIKDKKPGDTTGQGVGGTWWTVVVSGAMGPAATAASDLVKTAPATLLVSAKGMSLYVFTVDKPGKSACIGACATYWPPLEIQAGETMPTATAAVGGKFGTATRADGSKQLTYDGAPLYTWIKDKKPGDVTGQGVGGNWWAVTA